MEYRKNSCALLLDLDYLKDCMIYFDNTVPLFHLSRTWYGSDNIIREKEEEKILNDILPKDLKSKGKNYQFYDKFLTSDLFLLLHLRKIHKLGYKYIEDPYSHPDTKKILKVKSTLFYELNNASINVKNGTFISFIDDGQIKGSTDVCVSLAKLKLIDTSKISYKEILELKKDRESIEKLRNLRLFYYQNYSGKSKAFIEDDILRRLYEYEETSKYWNFKTCLSTLNGFLSSKILKTSLVVSLLNAFFGDTTLSLIAAAGASIEFGKAAIVFSKERLEKNELLRKDPISFLYKLKNLKQRKINNNGSLQI